MISLLRPLQPLRLLRLLRLLRWIPVACAYACAATVVAQTVGFAIMWSRGAITQEKMLRYAAVIRGMDAWDLPHPSTETDTSDLVNDPAARETQLALRVDASPVMIDRRQTLKKETVTIQSRVRELKEERVRYEFVKKSFAELLDQLERDAETFAIQEVQRTLENLQPKQSKELILRMLKDEGLDVDDDVLGDVVAIVRSMPKDRLKKILGEFKTDDDKQKLHRVLVEIGEIDARQQGEPR